MEKAIFNLKRMQRQRMEETRIYGENACQKLFQCRPECIVRAWFIKSVTSRFRNTLRWLAINHKAYYVVDKDSIEKISGTKHHGGVCFLIKRRISKTINEWLKIDRDRDCVLALENINNPYNVGAIMRNSAHFGVKSLLVNNIALLESGAAVRIAEGGAEYIQALYSSNFIEGVKSFREAGYTVVTTSSHKNKRNVLLTNMNFPAKMMLILGGESHGLSKSLLERGDISVLIGGTGKVESLNVSVATGILLAEWWRQHFN